MQPMMGPAWNSVQETNLDEMGHGRVSERIEMILPCTFWISSSGCKVFTHERMRQHSYRS